MGLLIFVVFSLDIPGDNLVMDEPDIPNDDFLSIYALTFSIQFTIYEILNSHRH